MTSLTVNEYWKKLLVNNFIVEAMYWLCDERHPDQLLHADRSFVQAASNLETGDVGTVGLLHHDNDRTQHSDPDDEGQIIDYTTNVHVYHGGWLNRGSCSFSLEFATVYSVISELFIFIEA